MTVGATLACLEGSRLRAGGCGVWLTSGAVEPFDFLLPPFFFAGSPSLACLGGSWFRGAGGGGWVTELAALFALVRLRVTRPVSWAWLSAGGFSAVFSEAVSVAFSVPFSVAFLVARSATSSVTLPVIVAVALSTASGGSHSFVAGQHRALFRSSSQSAFRPLSGIRCPGD